MNSLKAMLFVVILCVACTSPDVSVTGQMFLSRTDGENVKLGGVPVHLYRVEDVRELMAQNRESFDPTGESRDIEAMSDFLFPLNAKPAQTTTTDADGSFSFTAKPDERLLVIARYRGILWIDRINTNTPKKVLLNEQFSLGPDIFRMFMNRPEAAPFLATADR